MTYPVYGSDRPYIGPEWQFQQAATKALDAWPGLVWCHVPNGFYGGGKEGKKMKRQGLKAGVFDILVENPNKTFHGLRIDLKVKGGKVSFPQMKWMKSYQNTKKYACICYNLVSVREVVKHYLNDTILHYQNGAKIVQIDFTAEKRKWEQAQFKKRIRNRA